MICFGLRVNELTGTVLVRCLDEDFAGAFAGLAQGDVDSSGGGRVIRAGPQLNGLGVSEWRPGAITVGDDRSGLDRRDVHHHGADHVPGVDELGVDLEVGGAFVDRLERDVHGTDPSGQGAADFIGRDQERDRVGRAWLGHGHGDGTSRPTAFADSHADEGAGAFFDDRAAAIGGGEALVYLN